MVGNVTLGDMKAALAAALIDEMQKKPLEKITVKELAQACGIKRQSFYYHFPDIYALLDWILEQDRAVLLSAWGHYFCWQEYTVALLKYLDANRPKILAISKSLGWRYVTRAFQPELQELLRQAIMQIQEQYAIEEGTFRSSGFLSFYCFKVLSALLESWVLGEISDPPEMLVKLVDTIIYDELRGAFLRSSGPSENDPLSDGSEAVACSI